MKNFISLIEPDTIFNYVGNLWRSDIFKQSHENPNGYIHKLIKDFSNTPRVFFDMHVESMEMVHFSSWFHAIQHRKHYTNDVLHDLYYHHEFFHINTMTYHNDFSFMEWQSKMKENEFWASLESEVLIYFYLPELRKVSFKKEIWADQFLNNTAYHSLFNKYNKYQNSISNEIKQKIANARQECETNPITSLDKEIFDYTISSNEWANIWKDNWYNVENHMVSYLQLIPADPNKALNEHITWLEDLQSLDSHNIAFGSEARAYSAVHKRLFQSAYTPAN
jgi:hypothetical protein